MSRQPIYEEEFDGIILYEYEEFEPRSPSFLVLGLPDTGLVGVITVNHLCSSLGLKEVGGIDFARVMPPVAVIRGGELKTPIRFFFKDNIVALASEAPIPPQAIYPLSSLIVDYALRRGINYIVSIVGIASPNRMELPKPRVYWIASNEKARKLVEGLNLENFSDGYLVGPYAQILKQCVRKRASNIVLLADAYIEFPDPEAAAEVVQVLSKIMGVQVDVKKLLDEAELIRLKLRELMRQTRQTIAEMHKVSPPTLYA